MLIGLLCIIGVVLLMSSFAMIAAIEPGPDWAIRQSRILGIVGFVVTLAWFGGVIWFAGYLARRARHHEIKN